MVEYIGLLKIKVIRGTNLAIRDMMSSDPYVVMTLGQQVSSFLINFLCEHLFVYCSRRIFIVFICNDCAIPSHLDVDDNIMLFFLLDCPDKCSQEQLESCVE